MIWDLHCHLSGVPGRTPDDRCVRDGPTVGVKLGVARRREAGRLRAIRPDNAKRLLAPS